jgi:hypothetical protein
MERWYLLNQQRIIKMILWGGRPIFGKLGDV